MTSFATLTGLADQGPHRAYADYLLIPVPSCLACNGRGGTAVFRSSCRACGGGGRVFGQDSPQITAIVTKVLEFFPEAKDKPLQPACHDIAMPPASPVVAAPKPLPTCFVAVTAPRAPHPLVRLWSGIKSVGAKALDLIGTALLVFQVVTFSWATALLVISREFVWVPVVAIIGVVFTWLAIEHAGLIARKWGTLSWHPHPRDDDPKCDDDEADVYRRRRA